MKRKTKSLWQIACERESEHGGGMDYILNFLSSIHCTTDESRADLKAAMARFNEQMDSYAKSKGF